MNNQKLTLNCNTANFDNCSVNDYKWKKDDVFTYLDNHYIAVNSYLIIVNLTIRDAGHYQCTVFDNTGKKIATNTIRVIIKGTYITSIAIYTSHYLF